MTPRKKPLSAYAKAITSSQTVVSANVMQGKSMTNTRYVGYFRVSTARQGRSGLGLDAQKEAVRQFLAGDASNLIAEFVEVESGKRSENRPKLAEAMRLCRLRGAVLLIAKIDRLARNVAFISALMESGVSFVAADIPKANDFTLHVLAAVAENEAKMISSRTRAALAAAKARGVKLGGNPTNLAGKAKLGAAASAHKRSAAARARREDLLPVFEDIKASGAVSLGAIAAELNARGIPTARGGQWSPVQVRRVLAA